MKTITRSALKFLILGLLFAVAAFGQMRIQTITIASGASASSNLKPMGSCVQAFIVMPATWTAASLAPEISTDGVTFSSVFDEYGGRVLIATDASRAVRLVAADYLAFPYLRFSSVNSSGVAVNQGGARSLTFICATR